MFLFFRVLAWLGIVWGVLSWIAFLYNLGKYVNTFGEELGVNLFFASVKVPILTRNLIIIPIVSIVFLLTT
jgi:hypothetical protein